MNIDKNLIKYWSYLCESEENKYNDYDDEKIQFQDAIEQNAGYNIIHAVLDSLYVTTSNEIECKVEEFKKLICGYSNSSRLLLDSLDDIEIEFGGMPMIQKNDSDYVFTKQCREIFSIPNPDESKMYEFFVKSPRLHHDLSNGLTKQFKNKLKIIKTEQQKTQFIDRNDRKNHQDLLDLLCDVEIKPGKYEAYANNISFGRIKSGTFKITLEFHKPTKMHLIFFKDKRGLGYYVGTGEHANHVKFPTPYDRMSDRILRLFKSDISKPLIPKESKEKNYDDFIPDDVLKHDDMQDKIDVLDYLSKEFKNNPDKMLNMLAKHKEKVGDVFCAIRDAMIQLKKN